MNTMQSAFNRTSKHNPEFAKKVKLAIACANAKKLISGGK